MHIRARADPRLLGALRKTVSRPGGGSSDQERKNETHLSVFYPALNRARGKHLRNSICSVSRYAFNSLFSSRARDCTTFTLHDLTDFLRRNGDSAALKLIIIHFFIAAGQIQNKIKTSLRARGAPAVSGALQLAYSAYKEDRLWLGYLTLGVFHAGTNEVCGKICLTVLNGSFLWSQIQSDTHYSDKRCSIHYITCTNYLKSQNKNT